MSTVSPIAGYTKVGMEYVPPFKIHNAPNPYGLDFQTLLNREARHVWTLVRDGATDTHETGDILLVLRTGDGTLDLATARELVQGLSSNSPDPILNSEDINPTDLPKLEGGVILRPRFN